MKGILLESGEVIEDPTWYGEDDVMRSAHGHGVNRVSGKLIELQDKVNETVAKIEAFNASYATHEPRCEDYSWLFIGQCAHCLGHVPSWDEPKIKRNIND